MTQQDFDWQDNLLKALEFTSWEDLVLVLGFPEGRPKYALTLGPREYGWKLSFSIEKAPNPGRGVVEEPVSAMTFDRREAGIDEAAGEALWAAFRRQMLNTHFVEENEPILGFGIKYRIYTVLAGHIACVETWRNNSTHPVVEAIEAMIRYTNAKRDARESIRAELLEIAGKLPR